MAPRFLIRSAGLLVLVACGKTTGGAPPPSDWQSFDGIQYRAPVGTNVNVSDGVLPGPGGQGGIPSGVRPMVVLTKPNPNGFYVEIVRTAPTLPDGTGHVIGFDSRGKHYECSWSDANSSAPAVPEAICRSLRPE